MLGPRDASGEVIHNASTDGPKTGQRLPGGSDISVLYFGSEFLPGNGSYEVTHFEGKGSSARENRSATPPSCTPPTQTRPTTKFV